MGQIIENIGMWMARMPYSRKMVCWFRCFIHYLEWIMSAWWSVNKSKPASQTTIPHRCVSVQCTVHTHSHSLLLIHDVSSMSFLRALLSYRIPHESFEITRTSQKSRQRHSRAHTHTNSPIKRDWQKSNDNCFQFHLKIF